jgi:hypothetical protein
MKNSDQPIYPINEDDKYRLDSYPDISYIGLTKREYFAAMAMQGLLAGDRDFMMKMEDIVKCAISHTDALLKELETKTEQ